MEKKNKLLHLCGALGIISFLSYFCAVVFSPLAYPGYDWMSQAVSDLSAKTAPSKELCDQLSCLYTKCGLVSITAVCIYIYDIKKVNKFFKAGVTLFAIMNWISAVGYDLFPLSESGKDMTTFGDIMHVYVVTASVVLCSIASLICIIISGFKDKRLKFVSICAVVALTMMFVGAIGTNIVPSQYFGIVERFSVFSAVGFNALLGGMLLARKL